MHFWCNLDGRIIDVILMYIFDIILMDRKSTQLQFTSFDDFLKDKKSWSFQCPLLIVFSVLKMRVVWPSFGSNLILVYSFVPPGNILCGHIAFRKSYTSRYLYWFNLSAITVISSWYLLWEFPGNGQRRHPFSVSFSMFDWFLNSSLLFYTIAVQTAIYFCKKV